MKRPATLKMALREEGQRIPGWAKGKTFFRIAVSEKCVALTFDDGPWPGATTRILKILKEHGARATFFMIGSQIRQYPKLAQMVRDSGHAIGNHTWSHTLKPDDSSAEVALTDSAIREVLGIKPTLFRPPFGNLTNGTAVKAKHADEAVMIWSVDTFDWRRPGASIISRRAVRGARPGGVVLMHDGGGNREQTVAALPRILRDLKRKGYRFNTIPELLALQTNEPRPSNSITNSMSSGGSVPVDGGGSIRPAHATGAVR